MISEGDLHEIRRRVDAPMLRASFEFVLSRSDVRTLLAEVEELRADLAALRACIEQMDVWEGWTAPQGPNLIVQSGGEG